MEGETSEIEIRESVKANGRQEVRTWPDDTGKWQWLDNTSPSQV